MRFEFGPEDGPELAKAEAQQAIATQLKRLADAAEEDHTVLPDGGTDPLDRGADPEIGKATHVGTALGPDDEDGDGPDVGPADLTLFQLEMLYVLAESGPQHGLGIKDELGDLYGETVNHGRLYPNLGRLAERDLVECREQEIDDRTNEYALTREGSAFLRADADRRSRAVERLYGGDR